MRYTIYHLTRFRYTAHVVENVMEVRVQPLDDAQQTCVAFSIATRPEANVVSYQDSWGTRVLFFDVPGRHTELSAIAVSVVDVADDAPTPETLPPATWEARTECRGPSGARPLLLHLPESGALLFCLLFPFELPELVQGPPVKGGISPSGFLQ